MVPPETEYIASALESLFSDQELARQMGEAVRHRVEDYTWDHTSRNLLKLFKKTLTDKRKVIDNPGIRPLVGAHYYTWYQTGANSRHWNENSDYATVDDLPALGKYSSKDRHIIARHLQLVKEAGLDYLVINLQVSFDGLDKGELEAVDLLFDMAFEYDPALSLSFMISCEKADSNTIDSAIDYLEMRYVNRENYLYLNSKPVLWFFISESFIGHFYHHFSSLSETTRRYHCIAAAGFCYTKYLPAHYSEFFDGWTLYSPLQISPPRKWEPLWNSGYRDFADDSSNDYIGAFTICPGFNDSGLTQIQRVAGEYRNIPRNGLNTYLRMQRACLDLDESPDLVVITSFNEFHENTHIEPSNLFDNDFIESTREFCDNLKSRGAQDPRQSESIKILTSTKHS